MLRPRSPRRTDPDLPGFTRNDDGRTWTDTNGQVWRHVRRRHVSKIAEDSRRDTLVVSRFLWGYYPRTIEGAAVRALLESPRTMRLDLLLGYCEKWTEDPWAFFLRAFADDRALLSVLAPVEGKR
jgi:hypothetical protein